MFTVNFDTSLEFHTKELSAETEFEFLSGQIFWDADFWKNQYGRGLTLELSLFLFRVKLNLAAL